MGRAGGQGSKPPKLSGAPAPPIPMSPPIPKLAVSNTKLAATALALGFRFECDLIQPAKGGPMVTQFLFSGSPLRPQFAESVTVADLAAWQAGELESRAPMHPVCVMMRAQHNYDRLLDMQAGHEMRLVSVAGGRMTVYKRGQEHAAMQLRTRCSTPDLALAAALAGVGLPTVAIRDSGDGRHVYELPCTGFVRLREDGSQVLEDALALMTPAPLPGDPLHLAVEDRDPMHPVVLGYDALHCRAHLKRALMHTTPLLLMTEQDGPRQALITMNAAGRVMERANAHFRAPALNWDPKNRRP